MSICPDRDLNLCQKDRSGRKPKKHLWLSLSYFLSVNILPELFASVFDPVLTEHVRSNVSIFSFSLEISSFISFSRIAFLASSSWILRKRSSKFVSKVAPTSQHTRSVTHTQTVTHTIRMFWNLWKYIPLIYPIRLYLLIYYCTYLSRCCKVNICPSFTCREVDGQHDMAD